MTSASVLIVDDEQQNLDMLEAALAVPEYELTLAHDGTEALHLIHQGHYDLILLDINMPEIDGFDVCEILKADDILRDIPVIFISAMYHSSEDKIRGFEAGGVDYITVPFHVPELLARVKTHVDLYQKQREIEALRQRETTFLKQLNQIKDDLLGMVSHDMKNPLSVVIGNVQLLEMALRKENIDSPRINRYVAKIFRASEQINRLIHDLLDMARTESQLEMVLEPVLLIPYLKRNVDDFVLRAKEKEIELIFSPPEDDLTILLAPRRFDQALQNLLSNAIKYTPSGGRVELASQITDTELVISVQDNGIGIPAKDIPLLFDRFYRVDQANHREQAGTGLGMAIVKAMVEQHGATVQVESGEGTGTTFSIHLPIQSIP